MVTKWKTARTSKKNHTYFLELISLQGGLFVHLCTASSLPLLDRSVEVQVQQPGGRASQLFPLLPPRAHEQMQRSALDKGGLDNNSNTML